MKERLQKILARAGIGSRRYCDDLIAHGRVLVNGKIATPGQKADPHRDEILLDGKPVKKPDDSIYIALYKPRNVLSAVGGRYNRKTVRDLLPLSERLYPVGRLDVDSEGLILMTNDGELTNRLTHPRYGHKKVYRVLVARHPDSQQLDTWRRGVVLRDGYKTAPAEIEIERAAGKGMWLRVTLREGRKRQIRETGILLGLPVVRIVRIGIGEVQLGRLKPGQWRYLTQDEIALLQGVEDGDQKKIKAPLLNGPRRPRK